MAELGELLQQARSFKGVSLREAERATRISRQYLEALEADDFTQLPADAYARGIVRNYAMYLGLDPQTVLTLYEKGTGRAEPKHEVVPAITDLKVRSHWAPNFAIIAFMVVISAIVFAWMYSAYFQSSEGVATRTIGISTVTPAPTSLMTVAAQGGGSSTVTPTPQASPTVGATATVAEQAPEDQPTDTPVEDDTVDDEPTSTSGEGSVQTFGEGPDAFVIWALGDVWVDITLDGAPIFSNVVNENDQIVCYGSSISVDSGNAQLVEIWINGVDYGNLGDTWDSTFTYP
jgi:cytoskeletal protein RodZ